MSSTPRARPTIYRGVQYRSRLEATWAAFFHLAGIKVWYESREDLPGWIPDFEIEYWPGMKALFYWQGWTLNIANWRTFGASQTLIRRHPRWGSVTPRFATAGV